MANKLIYSASNVLQMYSTTPPSDPRYLVRDFDDVDFLDTIKPWEQRVKYEQPWQLSDSIPLQLRTNVGPVNFVLKTIDGAVVDTVLFTKGAESVNEPGLFLWELLRPLNIYTGGCYYVELSFGAEPVVFTLRSGELKFAETHPETILLQFKHFEFREDLIFETGFFPAIRVIGRKKYLGPKQSSTVYNDQSYNLSALRSTKYRLWELSVGGAKGVPDYIADIIGGAIGCSTFMVDDKAYTMPDGAELEPLGQKDYPMRSWRIEMRERYNRASKEYVNDIVTNAQLAAMVNVDSKGFGNSNSGSQTAILDVE